jgi:hypothetical protein
LRKKSNPNNGAIMTRCAILVAFLAAGPMLAQPAPGRALTPAGAQVVAPWQISLTLYGYLPPDEDAYANPNLAADRGPLHLEARYNYEDLKTGSLWVGYNFQTGKNLVLKLTPMVGGVFGRTTGIAPGCNASLGFKKFELSISNEYVFDTNDKSGNFYYSWPQLTYSPTRWLVVGLVAQQTKPFQTQLDTQRGFLVGFSHKKAEFTAYVFNLGWSDPTAVLGVAWNF